MKPSLHKQRGGVMILFALCLPVLLGVLGLALDSSMAYLIKAKLSASADAAVLAAGEASERGASNPEKERNARDAATRLFNANFPSSFLGATVGLDRIDIRWLGTTGVNITLSAHATYATTLGRLLGQNELRVNVAPQVTKNNGSSNPVDVALVMDTSDSLVSPDDFMPEVKAAVNDYASQFQTATDRLALIQFGIADTATVEVPFKTPGFGFDLAEVQRKVNGFSRDNGGTPTALALREAKQQLDLINSPGSMQYVLIFTDGAPSWELPDTPYPGDRKAPEKDAADMAEALRLAGYPIYAVGFNLAKRPGAIEQLHCWANDQFAQSSCQRPAQPVGQVCLSTDAASLSDCLQKSGPSRGASPLVLTE